MKFRIVKVPRRLPVPLWAAAIALAWLAFVCAVNWLGRWLDRPMHLCLFRKLTGIPCPTCGTTRSALSLLHGDLCGAWLCNPLLLTVAAAVAAAVAIRLAFGLAFELRLARHERIACWAIAACLFLANWAYLILAAR